MSKKIQLGVDDFSELVSKENNLLFVDKTLFIQEFIDEGVKLSLIMRPRRWGKTLNMSMLRYFFAPDVNGVPTKGLFDHLKIAQEKEGAYLKHQGTHPVIFISLKGVKGKSWENFLEQMYMLMTELYMEYETLLMASDRLTQSQKNIYQKVLDKTENTSELQNALKFLSQCLAKHYSQKIIILIDEYDTPLNTAYEKDFFEQAVDFFKSLLGAALKGNDAMAKGVMTGILRLSKNNMLSDLNNLTVYSLMQEKYSQHFGFSESEVQQLFADSGVPFERARIQQWYNGYQSGGLVGLYNPWSIVSCIEAKGALHAYWIKTGDTNLLQKLFVASESGVKEQLHILMNGGVIESPIDEHISFSEIRENKAEVLWSLLWALGYLTVVGHHQTSGIVRYKYPLMIPNYEIESSYRVVFMEFIDSLEQPDRYEHCLSYLVVGEVEAFARDLRDFMLCNVSYMDCSQESNYHMLILGMSAFLKETHDVLSNIEQGKGRPDLVFIPKDLKNSLGIILEFKRVETGKTAEYYEQCAVQGLAQINHKQYDVHLRSKSHIQKILKLCMVFYGKDFTYQFVVESLTAH